MQKLSFFKLPMIGTIIYFLISFLLYFLFTVLYFSYQLHHPFTYLSFRDIGERIIVRLFLETLWLFGFLSLILCSANINMVNKTNIRLLVITMPILSFIVYFIRLSIRSNIIGFGMFFDILLNIFGTIISLLFYSLSAYYLIKFFGRFFIKNQSPFVLTTMNSVKIHFILFLVFNSYILILGYNLIVNSFEHVYILGTKQYQSINFFNIFFVISLLLGIFSSKKNFLCAFKKIQYDKLINSSLIASGIILIFVFIDYFFMLQFMDKLYINSFREVFNLPYLIFLLLLQPLFFCLVLNIVTRRYFSWKINNTNYYQT